MRHKNGRFVTQIVTSQVVKSGMREQCEIDGAAKTQ